MFFQQGGFKCTANTTVFFMFSLPVLKANQPKTVVFTVFGQDNMQKKRCFGTIFRIFSARARQVKSQLFFAAFLPPLIWTQEGVKSPKIAKLHLNFTFYLSQSLPQSCNTKNYRRLSGASKCCKLRCFMNVPCILPAKKGTPPPQLKLTVLVPPERHALLHLRCGRISFIIDSLIVLCRSCPGERSNGRPGNGSWPRGLLIEGFQLGMSDSFIVDWSKG